MKRKRLDRDIWTSITKKRYAQKALLRDAEFAYAALLEIDEVSERSVWNYPEGPVVVCGKGVRWLQLLARTGKYLVTAMIAPEGGITQWYIDILDGYGFCEDGVIYYDDLYLDLIQRPDGMLKEDDMDELLAALRDGDITRAQYEGAVATGRQLRGGLLKDIPMLIDRCDEYLKLF